MPMPVANPERIIRIDSHPQKEMLVGTFDDHGNRIALFKLRAPDKLRMDVKKTTRIWFEYLENCQ